MEIDGKMVSPHYSSRRQRTGYSLTQSFKDKYPSMPPADVARIALRKDYLLRGKIPPPSIMLDLVPEKADMADHDDVSLVFFVDLQIIEHWLDQHPKPSLETVVLIHAILNRWDACHRSCYRQWPRFLTLDQEDLIEALMERFGIREKRR
jgi:hypothetical protein